jgi:hypothetical protein
MLGIVAHRKETTKRIEDLWNEWTILRNQLAVYPAAHPSPRVVEIANELATAVPSAIGASTRR